MSSPTVQVEERARRSRGTSSAVIYELVTRILRNRLPSTGVLLDVGCGVGNLWDYTHGLCSRYIGADVIRYEGFPAPAEFCKIDLDSGRMPLEDGVADVVASVETIEHLENPRAFFRELVRVTRPGGWIVVTTPNQCSLLSKLTFLVKNQFNAFQDGDYPAHITALLEIDLRRIAKECGLIDVAVAYTLAGRLPGTSRHYPRFLSRLFPRSFSDNVSIVGRKGS